MTDIIIKDVDGRTVVIDDKVLAEAVFRSGTTIYGVDFASIRQFRMEYRRRNGPDPITPDTIKKTFNKEILDFQQQAMLLAGWQDQKHRADKIREALTAVHENATICPAPPDTCIDPKSCLCPTCRLCCADNWKASDPTA